MFPPIVECPVCIRKTDDSDGVQRISVILPFRGSALVLLALGVGSHLFAGDSGEHCRMFIRISGLYSPDVGNIPEGFSA